VVGAFRRLCAEWDAGNKLSNDITDKALQHSIGTKRRPKQKQGSAFLSVTLAAGVVALVAAAFMSYTPKPAAPPGGSFGSESERKEAEISMLKERRRERLIIPLTDAQSRAANLCEFYTLSGQLDRKGTCP